MTPTYKGIELFDANMVFHRTVFNSNGHKDVCKDVDGTPILVITNSNENPVTLPDFPNGIIKINLATGEQTGLISLPWSSACHISCPDQAGFALVSTYPANDGPYGNAILKIPLDGSAMTVLAKHGSKVADYQSQPKATVSRDGSRVVYGSNGGVADGPVDTYLLLLGAPVPPPPMPPPPAPPVIIPKPPKPRRRRGFWSWLFGWFR